MDYVTHYERLISRARSRLLTGYVERHHVVPRCLGGDNSRENVVRLTPEEHYTAHQLLVRMYPGNHKLLWAAVAMTNASGRQARSNKLYGWLRRAFAESLSQRHRGKVISPETRRRMSESRLGKRIGPHSAETKAKMSAASKGRKKSEAHRAALALAKIGKKRGPQSAEHIANRVVSLKAAMAGSDYRERKTDEYRRHQALVMQTIWERRRAGEMPLPRHLSQ